MRDGEIISDQPVTAPASVRESAGVREVGPVAPAVQASPLSVLPTGNIVLAFGTMVLAAAVQAIGRNKMRSALTMLGVFIGVSALIVMVAVGQGASDAVKKQIESLGTNLVVILPGAVTTGGIRAGSGSASTLTVADARAIRRDDPAVAQIGYLIRQQGQVEYGNQNWTTTIQGVSDRYPAITNWQIAAGRGISTADENQANLVALIGHTVHRQLFSPHKNPIDAWIEIKGVTLQVIGVLAAKGQSPFGQDQDDLVMIPFTTAERKVLGVAAPSQQQTPLNWPYLPAPNPYNLQLRMIGYANQIYVQAVSQPLVAAAIDEATDTLMLRHHIRSGELADFSVRNVSQFVETAESSSRVMALLLAAVASISLLVGGIGIMNILLVSVTERTREIGLRMAIGARELHVLLQFLAEAVFSQRQRRPRRHRDGARLCRRHSGVSRLGGAGIVDGDLRRVCRCRRGRCLFRLLLSAQSRPPQPD